MMTPLLRSPGNPPLPGSAARDFGLNQCLDQRRVTGSRLGYRQRIYAPYIGIRRAANRTAAEPVRMLCRIMETGYGGTWQGYVIILLKRYLAAAIAALTACVASAPVNGQPRPPAP